MSNTLAPAPADGKAVADAKSSDSSASSASDSGGGDSGGGAAAGSSGDSGGSASGGDDSGGGGSAGSTSYTVKKGDTLMMIAFENYGDLYKWKQIYEANKDKIKDPNQIPSGTVLTLDKPASDPQIDRNGEKYLIKKGDTLGSISNQVYGTPAKWKKLWRNNKQLIKDPNKIFAGFYLYYLPEGNNDVKGSTEPMANSGGGDSGAVQADASQGDAAPADAGAAGTAPPAGAPPAGAPPAGAMPATAGTPSADARAPSSVGGAMAAAPQAGGNVMPGGAGMPPAAVMPAGAGAPGAPHP